ncbi:MAG: hypothetical protein US70_C0022G0048 [Parcubacteria group bacterium GW2011_GWD2_38_11]|nr:MAG: hypothetical protein US70_C0022G0048 [Parcubacteria group bacterium GW2011_GWD2_38_11]
MKIKEAMTSNVISVTVDTKITDVAKILHTNRIHGVPVVSDSKLVGIITETDFFTKNEVYLPFFIDFLKNTVSENSMDEKKQQQFKQLLEARAVDIMSENCTTLCPDDDISAMFKLIKESKLHTVPVISENNELVGVITIADIVKLIQIPLA